MGEVKLLFWLGVLFKALFRLPLLAVSDPFGFDADDSSLTSGPVGVEGTPPAKAGADTADDDGVGVPVLIDDAAAPISPFAPSSPGIASAVAPGTPFSTVPLAPSCPTDTVGIDAPGLFAIGIKRSIVSADILVSRLTSGFPVQRRVGGMCLRFWFDVIAVATPVELRSTIYVVCPGGWTEIGASTLAGSYEQRVPVFGRLNSRRL